MEEDFKQRPSKILKIAIFGPESTGKTTLAKQLAKHFKTTWVAEFAREYLEEKLQKTQEVCTEQDMLPIAAGQILSENKKLESANGYLFCDTNLLVTKIFSEINYKKCNPILNQAAIEHQYDLTILTDIDMPWEKDTIRDSAKSRDENFVYFEKTLQEYNIPYLKIAGNKEERLQKAIDIITRLKKTKKLNFSSHDFVQIEQQGISIHNIQQHLNFFENGIPKMILQKPATIKNGISIFTEEELKEKVALFEIKKSNLTLEKFVPASGAASRMFQFLDDFLNRFKPENETINGYINKNNATPLSLFLAGMEKFPFFEEIDITLNTNFPDFASWEKDKKNYFFIQYLLQSEYFDFGNKPKGILPFHKYKTHIATAIEEHYKESLAYTFNLKTANLHFTITDTHQIFFENTIEKIKSRLGNLLPIAINFSYQSAKTNTIAVDMKNEPLRNSASKLLFRPGGHGALIKNLNKLESDLIFIKNIDNVSKNQSDTLTFYKKALAGILLELQEKTFNYLTQIDNNTISEKEIPEIVFYAKNKLNCVIKKSFDKYTFHNKLLFLKKILHKPIRVCGMVKNENEPGGGPFWVYNSSGKLSLQIVEMSQVDIYNKNQIAIMNKATHFNPVDIVCGIKDYNNKKFNLTNFIDKNSGFIVEKSKNGVDYKAYELPGLWNGGMAKWITIFVEVPLQTFNPVKTVNDLLKPAHQEML